MSSDRELRAQIEEAEGRLRASRQRLLEQRETFPSRAARLEEDRRVLSQKLDSLRQRIAQARAELEKVNAVLGEAWEANPVYPVSEDYSGQGSLTVVDGMINALFGQTPDWAVGQPFTTRFLIRFNQGMGRKGR
jgi:predicted nuclease with TOPRIM domain